MPLGEKKRAGAVALGVAGVSAALLLAFGWMRGYGEFDGIGTAEWLGTADVSSVRGRWRGGGEGKEGITRVVCMGDSHSRHESVHVPAADVFLHSGDFSMFGNREHIKKFNDWLGMLPHRHKLVVAGNHDSGTKKGTGGTGFLLQELKEMLTNAVYLEDEWMTSSWMMIVCFVCTGAHATAVPGFGSFMPDAEAESGHALFQSRVRPANLQLT